MCGMSTIRLAKARWKDNHNCECAECRPFDSPSNVRNNRVLRLSRRANLANTRCACIKMATEKLEDTASKVRHCFAKMKEKTMSNSQKKNKNEVSKLQSL